MMLCSFVIYLFINSYRRICNAIKEKCNIENKDVMLSKNCVA